jgi:hypothetical protein
VNETDFICPALSYQILASKTTFFVPEEFLDENPNAKICGISPGAIPRPTPLPTISPTAAEEPVPPAESVAGEGGLFGGVIAGIAVGCVIVVGGGGIFVIFFILRRRNSVVLSETVENLAEDPPSNGFLVKRWESLIGLLLFKGLKLMRKVMNIDGTMEKLKEYDVN